MAIISKQRKAASKKFVTKTRQWLRIQKWNLEQEIKKVENNSQYQNTCCRIAEVIRDIEAAYRLIS